ncbi:NAD-binding protein [Mycobacterium sp.]|uniref:NAD-binding protein n=1 Tax=Mycobacterium sp. TaxID=1785 RepID=UPI00127B0A2D|nr:NAD-binding protein [Mycobacterium sp.]KAA8969301.1 MAG: potassium transporter TrkA [Mycobacterium sp.]
MERHIIVRGDDALADAIVEELAGVGARVVRIDSVVELEDAGVAEALAVVCAGPDDARNLEIALRARRANPNVRVVARLANEVLKAAVSVGNGPGAILDVADLAAPSIVEACLALTAHHLEVAGVTLVIAGAVAPRDATLRQIYGDLAPVAVIHGENSPTPGEVVACPGRDERVSAGDWIAVIGTAEELSGHGIKARRPSATRARRPWFRRMIDAGHMVRQDINPLFVRALAVALLLLVGSTIFLRFSYQRPGMAWVDALYFASETIATVGYGDFSFVQQPTWLRLFAVMLMFAGVTTTAILVAFVADMLLSRRIAFSAGRRRARHLRNHIIVVGLGSFGIRVVTDLSTAGYEVAVIERDEGNRFLTAAAELGVPVIFGDATLRQTLALAGLQHARAVAVLTNDDMVNIETGIVLREMLGPRVMPEVNRLADVPIVLRVYDRVLGSVVAQRFGFDSVRSTVDLAVPWFIGAAMGLQVLQTFSVGQRSFMVGGMHVGAGSELDGLPMLELSTKTRVVAIARDDADLTLHPRRATRLRGGDTVYLVGPYHELLVTLRKGQTYVRASGQDPQERADRLREPSSG